MNDWLDMPDVQIKEALAATLGGAWRVWRSDMAPRRRTVAQFTEGKDGRLVVCGLLVLDTAVTTDQLKAVAIRAMEAEVNAERAPDRDSLAPLVRAGRTSVEFARLVADHYQAWASVTPHPVAAMASTAEAKAPTVHGWVREARLRGFLPPACRTKHQPGGWNA